MNRNLLALNLETTSTKNATQNAPKQFHALFISNSFMVTCEMAFECMATKL